jgi:hypothetical protein
MGDGYFPEQNLLLISYQGQVPALVSLAGSCPIARPNLLDFSQAEILVYLVDSKSKKRWIHSLLQQARRFGWKLDSVYPVYTAPSYHISLEADALQST